MTIETKIDFKMYLNLMFTLSYRKPTMIFLTLTGVAMILVSVLYFFGIHIIFDTPPHLPFVLGILVVAIFPFSIYRSSRKNYDTYDLLREKIIYEFTDEMIVETGDTFDSEMEWDEISDVLELKKWIILYHQTGSATFLPKQAFGNNLNEFKELINRLNIGSNFKA